MVTIRKCNFCGEKLTPGTGIMYVDPSGAVSFFCSSKCEKCTEMKRSSRKVKWTNAYRKEKEIRVQHLKGSSVSGLQSSEKKAEDSKPKTEKPAAPKAEKKPKAAKKKK